MPTHTQNTVSSPVTERGPGASSSTDINAIYSDSPIHSGKMTAESVKEQYQKDILDGVINDAGHTFGTFDTSYSGAPDLTKVKTGGGGLPASAHVPNPSSPGPGSVNATAQPAAPDNYGTTPGSQWGSGVGSALGPQESSKKLSSQKLGDYVMGKATTRS